MLRDILDPKSSIYLDASAGSGKTKLLVDRIIKVLLSGTRPSRILCITFTKAAADEMYERLEEIILSFVILEEEALKAKLLELDCPIIPSVIREARGLFALFMEEKPLIQTIHAFCAKILQKLHFIEEEEAEEGGKILEEEERKKLFEEVFFRLMVDSKDLNDRVKFLLEEYDIKYLIELLEAFWISLSNSRTNLIKYDLPQVELEQFLSELLNQKLHISNQEPVEIAPDNPQELLTTLEKLDQDAKQLNFLTTNNLKDFSNYKGIFLTKEAKLELD
jgi:ATP-dependent exoDNAse (exonuclease V) beta subunit